MNLEEAEVRIKYLTEELHSQKKTSYQYKRLLGLEEERSELLNAQIYTYQKRIEVFLAKEDKTDEWKQFYQQKEQFQKMTDPDALERRLKIKEIEQNLNSDNFDSVKKSVSISFEDKETDMTEFNEYLMRELPGKEIQAVAEMVDC